MSTITLPNIRVSSDLTVSVRLKDNDVAIDWSTLSNVKASIYSDAQRALAGRCDVSVDAEDHTVLVCQYAANKPQYVGVCRIVVSAKYMGETKTYDKPAFNFVRWTADQDGEQITIDDPDVDVEIEVSDVSSSLLDEAIRAAFAAAEEAVDAKGQVLETEAEVEAAEALRVSAEESRVEAEEGRVEAEAARVDEEAVRVSAEDARVVAENARAAAEAARVAAEDLRVTAEGSRETAEAARVAAEALRVSAESSRETAEAARVSQASADHTVAAGDHTQAAADHTQAAADHTTAASDHTQAGADHTLAAADHVTAGEDHAQAQDDHEVMAGYDTRLGNVEGEVSQLEAKVTDLELPSGSYTQAQARVYNHPEEWCFLLNQPGTGIRKPIWHIGNGVFIDAAGAVISFEVITPATPTFSPDGGSVAEGTVVTLACATPDADIYVSTDDGETYTKTSTVTISEAVTLMAYSELEGIRSAVVSKVFTIAVDHRFKFTVKLDQDNATVYVPVANGNYYTMEVDWGDGSTPDSYNNALIGMKNCKHTYSGLAGDTFQITIRGTSIPYLLFSNRSVTAYTPAQLYSIDDNSLDTTMRFALNSQWAKIDFKGCANLVSVCKNLVSSVPAEERINIIFESCAALTTIPTEVFSAMTTIEYFYFNGCTALSMSAETMSVFATKIGNITNLLSAFGGCKGSIPIPDDFFDNLTDGTVTDVRQMTGSAATGVTGDAKKLYDVLAVKATSGIANTAGCFSGTNLSNRNQVPTAWGGTM